MNRQNDVIVQSENFSTINVRYNQCDLFQFGYDLYGDCGIFLSQKIDPSNKTQNTLPPLPFQINHLLIKWIETCHFREWI